MRFNNKFKNNSFDVIWAHDVLQYAINPLRTIREWCKIARDNAMLCIAVPESTDLVHNRIQADQYHNEYYHYTLVNLIHMLSVNGWDCNDASFYKRRGDPWLWAVVYKAPKFKKLDHADMAVKLFQKRRAMKQQAQQASQQDYLDER